MLIAILTGLASGIISGMGIGGGTILIPVLVFALGTDQHIAQSVNLLYFVPTAMIALVVHQKNKNIDIKIAIAVFLFGILGAIIGSRLAVTLPSVILKKMFGIFLLAMGIYESIRK